MKEIDSNYTVELRRLDENEWKKIASLFLDFSLFQTLPYDLARYERDQIGHLILRKGSQVVAAAQVRTIRMPLLGRGIAYVFWGPMWRASGRETDINIFRQAVRALRNEFSVKRKLLVRIFPRAFRENDDNLLGILEEEGYRPYHADDVNRTLLLPLDPSLEELRTSLNQKWRNCLNRAEKSDLEIVEGVDESLFDQVADIYGEMLSRKGIPDTARIGFLKKVQETLPEDLKMRVYLCLSSGDVCAGAVFSALGTTGVYLVGATSDRGLKTNGSYLIQWAFVRWLKERGFSFYDLHGVNPETNPGTYRFKRGVAGSNGKELDFLGKFQSCDNMFSGFLVRAGEATLAAYRKLKK